MRADFLKTTKDFLASVVSTKAPNTYLPGTTGKGLSTSASIQPFSSAINKGREALLLQILFLCAVLIPPPLTDIYQHLQLARNKGVSLVKELINSGFALLHQFHPSRRGGCFKNLEVLDSGWSFLENSGLYVKRPKLVLGGGWRHNLSGIVTAEVAKWQKYQPSFEVITGPTKKVRMDLVLEKDGEIKIFVQCCFSSPEREYINAITALSSPPVTLGRLSLVCKDKKFANDLSKLFKSDPVYKKHHDKVTVKVFADILEHYYKKTEGNVL